MIRSEGAKNVGPLQKNSLDPLLGTIEREGTIECEGIFGCEEIKKREGKIRYEGTIGREGMIERMGKGTIGGEGMIICEATTEHEGTFFSLSLWMCLRVIRDGWVTYVVSIHS